MWVRRILLKASLTIFPIFGFAYRKPETDSGALPPVYNKRDAISGQRLSNAERIARGLPLKAPVKKFGPTKTEAVRCRQSQSLQTPAFYIEAVRLNSNPPQASRVVFEVSGPLPAVGVTIKARNAIDGGVFPIVTRDWTNLDQPMSATGNHTVIFTYDPSSHTGDNGDPVGRYDATRHQSSNWFIPTIPGFVDVIWHNQDESLFFPHFFLDVSGTPGNEGRRVLRAANKAEDLKLGIYDEARYRVLLRTVPV
ncbi:uncharacterized protein L199_005533 [Kwoniella botswanensis]|uniref:uncharacterized protein n=1 Tax=Kwoniella botswanensis TaxID=1268659 RepID=UPI00315D9C62